MMDYYNNGYGMMGGWGALGLVFNMVVFIVVIVGVVLLVRRLTATSAPRKAHSALDIVKERYAKGEISKKEFDDIKKDVT